MILKIGKYCFINREALESLLKSKLIKEYDLSPEAREKHDEEARFTKDKKQIKATIQEIRNYWSEQIRKLQKVGKHIKPGEKIINPWIVD